MGFQWHPTDCPCFLRFHDPRYLSFWGCSRFAPRSASLCWHLTASVLWSTCSHLSGNGHPLIPNLGITCTVHHCFPRNRRREWSITLTEISTELIMTRLWKKTNIFYSTPEGVRRNTGQTLLFGAFGCHGNLPFTFSGLCSASSHREVMICMLCKWMGPCAIYKCIWSGP